MTGDGWVLWISGWFLHQNIIGKLLSIVCGTIAEVLRLAVVDMIAVVIIDTIDNGKTCQGGVDGAGQQLDHILVAKPGAQGASAGYLRA